MKNLLSPNLSALVGKKTNTFFESRATDIFLYTFFLSNSEANTSAKQISERIGRTTRKIAVKAKKVTPVPRNVSIYEETVITVLISVKRLT